MVPSVVPAFVRANSNAFLVSSDMQFNRCGRSRFNKDRILHNWDGVQELGFEQLDSGFQVSREAIHVTLLNCRI